LDWSPEFGKSFAIDGDGLPGGGRPGAGKMPARQPAGRRRYFGSPGAKCREPVTDARDRRRLIVFRQSRRQVMIAVAIVISIAHRIAVMIAVVMPAPIIIIIAMMSVTATMVGAGNIAHRQNPACKYFSNRDTKWDCAIRAQLQHVL